MNGSFDDRMLLRRLGSLEQHARIVFAATCCERLLPNYALFVKSSSWGDPSILRAALDFIWDRVSLDAVDSARVRRLIDQCESVTPHSEHFDSQFTSAAIDAGTAILETLQALLDQSAQHPVNVASFCRDTIDMFIQIRDHLESHPIASIDRIVAEDPLMRYELRRQELVLTQLEQDQLDQALASKLRREAVAEPSIIGVDSEAARD